MKILKSFEELKGKTIKDTTLDESILDHFAIITDEGELLLAEVSQDGGSGGCDLNVIDNRKDILEFIEDSYSNVYLQRFLIKNDIISKKEVEEYQEQNSRKRIEENAEFHYQEYLKLKERLEEK